MNIHQKIYLNSFTHCLTRAVRYREEAKQVAPISKQAAITYRLIMREWALHAMNRRKFLIETK